MVTGVRCPPPPAGCPERAEHEKPGQPGSPGFRRVTAARVGGLWLSARRLSGGGAFLLRLPCFLVERWDFQTAS